jgi:RNA polymerase sigma-70 factor (ECF subfamily)
VLTLGERRSAEEFYRHQGDALWRAIYGYVGGRRAVADDVVAEAFARGIEHWSDIRNPTAWIYRTAFRLASMELKRMNMLSSLDTAREGVMVTADLTDLFGALARLPVRQRMAIVLHYVADLPVADVGAAMQVSSGTVRVHLHNGRRNLRALLETAEEADNG